MPLEPHDWNVPAPLRALLWWPPVAFVVAMLDPSAAAGTIAATGAVLVVLGVLASTVGGAIARRTAGRLADTPASTSLARAVADVVPAAVKQRAA